MLPLVGSPQARSITRWGRLDGGSHPAGLVFGVNRRIKQADDQFGLADRIKQSKVFRCEAQR
ncbi:hypothetical protein AWC27_28750 [Mycobacterium szulgai]|uniref:Uncharacterized protein n=2 Tax=Mycobacterium szulgai TaxID=1787 RepID=A0A1X2EI35_MYCSZ|nr:hypothetical protein AWC27_28750 [Mycobacterium szulgai]